MAGTVEVVRVLVVDDDPGILSTTAKILECFGCHVDVTPEAGGVLTAMRRFRPQVVLHDLDMPEMEIEGQLRTIRADSVLGRTPIVLFSANVDLPDVTTRLGAQGYVPKPFHPEEAYEVIVRAAST